MKPRHLERNADRNDIPATPDCRGGVFAVFAKIPPPTPPPSAPVLPPDAPTVPTTHAIHQWNPTVFVVGISVVLVCTWWQWEAGDGESHKDLGGGGAVGAARELPAHCLPFPCGLC